MWEVVYPKEAGERNEDYVMAVLLTGFQQRIRDKVAEGFDWIIPKDHITMKTGLIPGEISVNVTRFQGSGIDDRDLSRAEIEIRKQAYCAFDFLTRFVDGFQNAIFLEVAPKLGIRETRAGARTVRAHRGGRARAAGASRTPSASATRRSTCTSRAARAPSWTTSTAATASRSARSCRRRSAT